MENETTFHPPGAEEWKTPTKLPPKESDSSREQSAIDPPLEQEDQETGEQEPLSPVEAHRTWKEKFLHGVATDTTGLWETSPKLASTLMGLFGAGTAFLTNPAINDSAMTGLGWENLPKSPPEQFAILAGIAIGTAAIIKISSFMLDKMVDVYRTKNPNWWKNEPQEEMGAR